jgi:opacity protein-like surface antigen
MRDVGRALALALAAGAWDAAAAQTPEQPNLIFTISGGYLTGGSLWSVGRQPAWVNTATGYQYDTLALGRVLRPGFAATLGATYFSSPHLGYNFEIGFFGVGSESRCAKAQAGPYVADPDTRNQAACQYIQGNNVNGDVVGFLAGFIWRLTTRGAQPYIRAGVGGGIIGTSYVETWAPVILNSTQTQEDVFFLTEKSHKETTWMLSLGAGVMLPLAPGYQLRFEVRDVLTALPIPTAPAVPDTIPGNLPYAPIGTRLVHVPTIMLGLDVVLERKRGRRY